MGLTAYVTKVCVSCLLAAAVLFRLYQAVAVAHLADNALTPVVCLPITLKDPETKEMVLESGALVLSDRVGLLMCLNCLCLQQTDTLSICLDSMCLRRGLQI